MATATGPIIFDGHNDVLTRLLQAGGVAAAKTFLEDGARHIDVPKARRGGFGGGFFAIWVPSPGSARPMGRAQAETPKAVGPNERGARGSSGGGPAAGSDTPSTIGIEQAMDAPAYDLPLPAPLERSYALDVVLREASILFELERLGALRVCTSTDAIRRCFDDGVLAAILHIEGAEAIDADLHGLDLLHRAGLRSLGPVWSRNTVFADGVPFRFPSTPDIGGGLTGAGFSLVRRCNDLGIMIDLSHLNGAGFDDVARTSTAPLVATHSNAHRHCEHARNLTDRQLEAIRGSEGVVGLNFACAFLRSDGRMRSAVPFETLLRHLDHLLEHVGEDGVALGSDFDGAAVPDVIGNAGGLPALRDAMTAHGYGGALLEKICHRNWLRVLALSWYEVPPTGAPESL